MTDGIIQQTFNEWNEECNKRYYPFNSCNFPIQTELELLEQELIKRIKQFKIKAEHDYSELHEGDIDIAKAIEAEIELINKLIGDNQE